MTKPETKLLSYDDPGAVCVFLTCSLQAIFDTGQPVGERMAYGLYQLLDLLTSDIDILNDNDAAAAAREAKP